MLEPNEVMTIKTVSQFFWKETPPFGEWAAALIWHDDEFGPSIEAVSGRIETDPENEAHHIRGDVLAILAALQVAREMSISRVRLLTVNDSVAKTIPEYYDGWEKRKWLNAKRKPIDSLVEWKMIKALCGEIDVEWERRPKESIDFAKDYRAFRDMIEDRENEFWMQRAIDRDPWG